MHRTPDIQCSHIIRSAGICFQWWSCHCATDTLEGTPISSSILTVALQWYSWTDLYSVPFGVSRCLLVATYCVKNVPNHACLFFIFIFFLLCSREEASMSKLVRQAKYFWSYHTSSSVTFQLLYITLFWSNSSSPPLYLLYPSCCSACYNFHLPCYAYDIHTCIFRYMNGIIMAYLCVYACIH